MTDFVLVSLTAGQLIALSVTSESLLLAAEEGRESERAVLAPELEFESVDNRSGRFTLNVLLVARRAGRASDTRLVREILDRTGFTCRGSAASFAGGESTRGGATDSSADWISCTILLGQHEAYLTSQVLTYESSLEAVQR